MPSSFSWHPVWALSYFSPSCQGTTGSLANLDSSIDVAFVLPGVVTAEEGLSPALFPGNPGLQRQQRSHRRRNRIYLPPCPTPGQALIPPPSPVVFLAGSYLYSVLQGSHRSWEKCKLSLTWALLTSLPRPLSYTSHP